MRSSNVLVSLTCQAVAEITASEPADCPSQPTSSGIAHRRADARGRCRRHRTGGTQPAAKTAASTALLPLIAIPLWALRGRIEPAGPTTHEPTAQVRSGKAAEPTGEPLSVCGGCWRDVSDRCPGGEGAHTYRRAAERSGPELRCGGYRLPRIGIDRLRLPGIGIDVHIQVGRHRPVLRRLRRLVRSRDVRLLLGSAALARLLSAQRTTREAESTG